MIKSEKEKMLAGEIYDCGDKELISRWHRAKELTRLYNQAPTDQPEVLDKILSELLGSRGENVWIAAPIHVDYGGNIHIGNNCEINLNCTFLDCNTITIGDNTVIGAGSIVTKSIPADSLAVGNPCKVIRQIQ